MVNWLVEKNKNKNKLITEKGNAIIENCYILFIMQSSCYNVDTG